MRSHCVKSLYNCVDVGKSREKREREVVSKMRLRTRRINLPKSNLILAGLNRFRPHYTRTQGSETGRMSKKEV